MNATLMTNSVNTTADTTAVTPQAPIAANLDHLADTVTRLVNVVDQLTARTALVRSSRPQEAGQRPDSGIGNSVLSEAIATQTRRLSDIEDSIHFMLATLEV